MLKRTLFVALLAAATVLAMPGVASALQPQLTADHASVTDLAVAPELAPVEYGYAMLVEPLSDNRSPLHLSLPAMTAPSDSDDEDAPAPCSSNSAIPTKVPISSM